MPTENEIENAKTAAGGWTKQTLAQWGVPWPPPRGWKEAITKGHKRYYQPGKLAPNAAFRMSWMKFGPITESKKSPRDGRGRPKA